MKYNAYISEAGNWDIITTGPAEDSKLEGRSHVGEFDTEQEARTAIDEIRYRTGLLEKVLRIQNENLSGVNYIYSKLVGMHRPPNQSCCDTLAYDALRRAFQAGLCEYRQDPNGEGTLHIYTFKKGDEPKFSIPSGDVFNQIVIETYDPLERMCTELLGKHVESNFPKAKCSEDVSGIVTSTKISEIEGMRYVMIQLDGDAKSWYNVYFFKII